MNIKPGDKFMIRGDDNHSMLIALEQIISIKAVAAKWVFFNVPIGVNEELLVDVLVPYIAKPALATWYQPAIIRCNSNDRWVSSTTWYRSKEEFKKYNSHCQVFSWITKELPQ